MLSKEEVYEKLGDVPLSFTSYYKYTFNFAGVFDGYSIYASIGGNAEDIYRYDVCPESKLYLAQDQHYSLTVSKDNQEVYSEYTY